ncbi:MAG: mannitol dehydrogenase family protein [bacterium]|nr:mannitol dehydrogenase family protein [bacterium]
MLTLNRKEIQDRAAWEKAGVKVPAFDISKMIEDTKANPVWLHFGSGNIFRGFIAKLQQQLLEAGETTQGIIAGETFDFDIINKIYTPHDNLSILVGLKPDGSMENEVIASIAEGVKADTSDAEQLARLEEIFRNPSLQMVSFTITEKGYALNDMSGNLSGLVQADIKNGPKQAKHAVSVVTGLLYERYQNGAAPIAMVSMDNCSHNGEKLRNSVLTIAKAWVESGIMEEGFLAYVEDEEKVSFPWSMIDKITPRPAKEVEDKLTEAGIADMAPIVTSRNTFIAPFVNAEIPQYLVVEDRFPNGRPKLEDAGVYMTDRDTVNKTEKMKVTTCLNPLHTALAVYGCLLGYTSISSEMKDAELVKLIEKIGYDEGMPVVVNPGILDPMDFIHEVIDMRLPNPFIPDTPQRIATDTSQKVPVRFGETIKSYIAREDLDVTTLTYIPLAIAGWCRYLLGVDDNGETMEVSSDPMLAELTGYLKDVKVGEPESGKDALKPILSNPVLFTVNLYEVGLGEKVESMFMDMLAGKGAVRATLVKYLG